MNSNQRLDLALAHLCTHLHVIGPPGTGKTRILLWMFQQLARIPDATVFFFNPKGAVCQMARDWGMSQGLAERLRWFDPGDEKVVGYNPLRPNGLPVAIHAKAVREGIRAAWGQADFDDTPQLARFLFLVLFATRELEMTLVEAMGLLRPDSQVRRAILARVRDQYVREALQYLDSLRGQRQDDLLASSLARLESFVLDPTIRRILTQQTHSLNLGEVIASRGIFLGNFLDYQPLRPDDNRLLVRLIINDLVAHVFNRPRGERTPVYLILDEAQAFATADLCRALDQGRELGLHCILAHQYLDQLRGDEGSGLLYHSVMKCARTKLLFGGLSTEDLEVLTPEIMIDQYDPWRIKDELTSLECEPVETKREVVTEGVSTSESIGKSYGTSYTKGKTVGQGKSLGLSTGIGITETQGETESETIGVVSSRGYTSSSGRVSSSGDGSSFSTAESILPTESGFLSLGGDAIHSSGAAVSHFNSLSDISSTSDSFSDADTRTSGHAVIRARAMQKSVGQNVTTSQNQAVSQSQGENTSLSAGLSIGKNTSKTLTPFHEYHKRRIVSSRQFLTKEEQLTVFLQKIKSLPKGHFLLKAPAHKAVFVRAPFVKDPWISARKRTVALERIYQQPCYSTPEAIDAEEQDRTKRLQQSLQPKVKDTKIKTGTPPANNGPKAPAPDTLWGVIGKE